MPTHLKNSKVSAEGWSSVCDIDKTNTWLSDNQWIGWWRCDAICNVGLEVDYACVGEVDVASPSGYDWVRLDAFVTMLLEEAEEGFAHFR